LAVRESSPQFRISADVGRLSRAYARVRLHALVAANFANFQPVARLRVEG
jgi:hypothetical protein